jgi:uncharacterized protein HemY
MKTAIYWFVFLLIAVGVGIFAASNNGYVLIAMKGLQIETSLNLLIIIWVLTLIIFYFILKTGWGIRWLTEWKDRRLLKRIKAQKRSINN